MSRWFPNRDDLRDPRFIVLCLFGVLGLIATAIVGWLT